MKTGDVKKDGIESQPSANEETLRILKLYEDKMAALQKQLDELKQNPGNTTAGGTSASDILALAEAITNKTKKDINYKEGIDESQIPVEDYLDQKDWVRFCVPVGGYILADDRRMGQIVNLPYGKEIIFFEHLITNIRSDGKHIVTTPIATYTCKSKKEAKWIRDHSLFGTFIFEDMGQVPGTNAEKALRLGAIRGVLNQHDAPTIISQAKSFGVPFNANIEQMKTELAIAMCDAEYEKENLAKQQFAETAWKDTILMQQAGLK